jgi:hypothetical protein
MRMPEFTAKTSLYSTRGYCGLYVTEDSLNKEVSIIHPNFVHTECGNNFLNTVCPPFIQGADFVCQWLKWWGYGAYSACMRAHILAHVPWCADCSYY